MKPNVLWIYGEDLYPDLACYGNQTVQTPVLDHFASEGVLYTNAYAVSYTHLTLPTICSV